MHELWICRHILEIIQEHALKVKCTKVKVVNIEVGGLSMLDKSSLIFSFEVITKGTVAETAILKFFDVDGEHLRIKSMEVE